ncbi:MAG: alpha/beta hydrolase [Gammaproteobacteria bacterium]|nr:alpha/beta hydrolase [Gammaproteobacteria bacterium]
MLDQLADEPGPPITEMSPSAARELYRMMRPATPELEVGGVTDRSIPGKGCDIPLRIYHPAGEGPFPVLVNFHGGGWVIGDLDTADGVCRDFCNTARCVVVSVGYRLAPEHIFPAAVDDAYSATQWVADNTAELNGNGKIAVCGESAGGNLAAVVCLKARDEAGPRIDFQLLLYPVVDCDMTRQSYVENGSGYFLETDSMIWFWDHYCPDLEQRKDPAASPLLARNHAGLPPALVVTAEFDPLRDEGSLYAETLRAAGGDAQAVCYDGLVHDFFATASVFKASRPGFEHACTAVRDALA